MDTNKKKNISYKMVFDASQKLGLNKDDVVVVGTTSVSAILVPDNYEVEELRGKVIASTYDGSTGSLTYYVVTGYNKTPSVGDAKIDLYGKEIKEGRSLKEAIYGQNHDSTEKRVCISISRDSAGVEEEVFIKNSDLIRKAIDESVKNYEQQLKETKKNSTVKGINKSVEGVENSDAEASSSELSAAERGVAMIKIESGVPAKNEARPNPVKNEKLPKPVERENLPIFNPSQSESGVFGCWEFGEQSVAIVEQSKLFPNFQARWLSYIGKDGARKERYNAKIDAKIRNKDELLSGNSDEYVSSKERKSQVLRNRKLENEISTLNNAGIYNRKLRIYAVKKEGENIDYYVRFDYKKTPEPEKPEDIENNVNYFKIKKAGFRYISGNYTPVLEVYENRMENGKLSHSRTLSVVGTSVRGNKQLRAFCMAFSAADMAPPTEEKAFANAFYSADKEQRLHISDELAKAADEQRNNYFKNKKYLEKPKKSKDKGMSEEEKQDQERKYAEAMEEYNTPEAKSARAIEKTGKKGRGRKRPSFQKTSALKMIRDLLRIGGIAAGIFIAVGSQGHGYGVDAANRRDVQKITEEAGRIYVSAQLETSAEEDKTQGENQGAVPLNDDYNSMTNSAEPTLFNYKLVNGDTVEIDTSRPSIIAGLFMGENAETYGYDMQTDLQNVKGRGAKLAITNLFTSLDYTMEGIEGAYTALGEMAGQEVKEHGVKTDGVVYPNGTTDMNSFVEALESLGMAKEKANVAAESYTKAFRVAYEASKDMVSVEPEEEISYNLADGQLAETLGALINKDVTIISVNYDNVNNEGSVHALLENSNLIGISFNNGAGYPVEINNTSGIEAAILEAFDNAEAAEKDADDTTSAENYFKVDEYAPTAGLLKASEESKLKNYLSETYGDNVGVYYSINPGVDDNGKVAYETEFVMVGAEDLDITHLKTSVLSTTNQTTTDQKIIYCATHAISYGECSLGAAPGLYNSGEVEKRTVTNALSEGDKAVAEGVLNSEYTMTTPSSERER